MKQLTLLLAFVLNVTAEVIWFNNGRSIDGTILEANNTHVLFARSEDLQQFRFPVSLLTLDSQKLVELYHNTNRYGEIPQVNLPLDSRTLKIYTNRIDQLIKDRLKMLNKRPTNKADDHTWLRRTYLVTIGRIPNRAEIDEFMTNRDADKKDALIQKLLSSAGHVSHQLNWLSDLLRVKDRLDGVNINIGATYREYIRQQLQNNVPWDTFVKNLLDSEGDYFGGNPAAGYYLRDRGMQQDNIAHTVQIFLGTRLECAMCHNHPFDRWTQKEFYEMTAFTSGIGNVTNRSRRKTLQELNRMISRDGTPQAGKYQNWRNVVRDSIQFGVDTNGTGKIKLTDEFMEDDAKPGDTLLARAMFTPHTYIKPDEKNPRSLTVLARWLTDKNNPRFTTVISNRLWKRVFGVGLIEPVDNFMDSTIPENSDLMWFIERIMVSLNYDMREFQRVLLNTELFARESKPNDYESLETYDFSGPLLRRMTGEQLWDSLVTLVYNNIDTNERVYIQNQSDVYVNIYNKYKDWNGSAIYQDFVRIASANPEQRRLEDTFKSESTAVKPIPDRNLIRSSYLPYPASGGHLIRQFGGSDKLSIENSNSEPNTTQVLNLLNGFVEKNILNNKKADFIKSMQAEKNDIKRIENVFLSTLGRKPDSFETRELKLVIDEPDGYKHVAWILLNTHEFMFIK
jgi:hypothetical protein